MKTLLSVVGAVALTVCSLSKPIIIDDDNTRIKVQELCVNGQTFILFKDAYDYRYGSIQVKAYNDEQLSKCSCADPK